MKHAAKAGGGTIQAKWKTVPISELYEGLYDGPHATPKTSDSGPVFLGIKNVTDDGHLDMSDIRHIAEEDFARWTRRVVPKPGDIVFTYEATLNRYAIIPEGFRGCLGRRMALIRTDAKLVDARFLFYYFFSPVWREVIKKNMMTGATVDRIPLISFPNFPVDVPPLPVQRRIAGILSTYDELIENSQRRIRILEAMARALYREWFIHFRYPGSEPSTRPTGHPSPSGRRAGDEGAQHEKIPRVASALGDIPQGWDVKTIADICESVSYGYTASASREYVGPKFLRITDIVPTTIDWAGVPFCKIPEDKAPKYLLMHGDIVVARTGATTGYAKRLNKLHPETVFASYLVRARAKAGVSNLMLGIVMESDEYKQYIQTNIGGAAQPQANAVVLTSMRLAVPPSSVGDEFDRLVAPIIDEAELLAVKIQNLRQTRDLLLPRLLSGQVNLKDN